MSLVCLKRIERELNTLLSDVEMLRSHGAELSAKSDKYSRVVETELRNVITRFEDLNRRLNLAQVLYLLNLHTFIHLLLNCKT